jgi:hypothetical protein
MQRETILEYLESSSKHVGRLYPVLVDKYGNIIDGVHRLTADKKWPKVTVEGVETEEQRLIARLVSNVCRRNVPAKEKTEMLGRLGEIYLNEGVETGKIAYKIAEKTGMSYQWVTKYLPDRFKDPPQSERAKSALRRRAGEGPERRARFSFEFEEPPKGVVAIKAYGNTNFVSITINKQFYKQLEETAKKLEITPDKLLYNAIRLIIKSLSL